MSQTPAPPAAPAVPTTPEQAAQFLQRFGTVKQLLLKELHKVIIGQTR